MIELVIAVTAWAEALAALGLIEEVGDAAGVFGAHAEVNAVVVDVAGGYVQPVEAILVQVGLELLFFVPLESGVVAGSHCREVFEDVLDVVGEIRGHVADTIRWL